jgi:general secretion pathway protein D
MNKYFSARASLALLLSICLCLPSPIFAQGNGGNGGNGGKRGKKNFKDGVKYENNERWDLAAEHYALAVAVEPGNTEYRLRLLRAMQMASLMFAARGDLLEARNDYASAYNAYARAYTYDPTNERARTKMARMVEQQKAEISGSEPAKYNQRTGNPLPAGNETQPPQRPSRGEVMQRIEYKAPASLKLVIENLAQQLNLNVIFDVTFTDKSMFSLSLNDVTLANALDMVLMQNKLTFEQVDRRTIFVYADTPANRQRLEKLMIKTFYLSNADLNETRALVQSHLGQQRQIHIGKQLNALVIRATPSELAIAKGLIDSVDKNRSEVIIDINIYEVLNFTSLDIGNQLASKSLTMTAPANGSGGNSAPDTTASASLGDLGGWGRAGASALAGSFLGLGGGMGTIIGLPPSSLSLLQSKVTSKLLASVQVHSLDGEQNQTVVGRQIPYRTGTNFLTGAIGTQPGLPGIGYPVDNISYRDIGLVIDLTPTITNEGYVQVKMKLESSNSETTGDGPTLTPTLTKRSLTTISRVQDGVTAVVASVKQEIKGDSRTTIPVVGMIPILGRLFTTPKQSNDQSDIVITVTPHIIRTPEIKAEDHFARLYGTHQSGIMPRIEDVILRAQAEEEQERRVIVQQPSNQPGSAIINAFTTKP